MNRKKHILVVEDDIEQLDVLCEMLQNDFKLTTASSGKEAIAIFQKDYFNFDLILLDINLEDMTAYDVYKEWSKTSFSSIPNIIVVTAYNQTADILKTMSENSAFFHLTKPFSKKQLLSHIHKAFEIPFTYQKTYKLNLSTYLNYWLGLRNDKILSDHLEFNHSQGLFPFQNLYNPITENFDSIYLKNLQYTEFIQLIENDCGYLINRTPKFKVIKIGNHSKKLDFLTTSSLNNLDVQYLNHIPPQRLHNIDFLILDCPGSEQIVELIKKNREDLFPWDEKFEPAHYPEIIWLPTTCTPIHYIESMIKSGVSYVLDENIDTTPFQNRFLDFFDNKNCILQLPKLVKKLLSQPRSFRIRWDHWSHLKSSEKDLETLSWLFNDFQDLTSLLSKSDLEDPELNKKLHKPLI